MAGRARRSKRLLRRRRAQRRAPDSQRLAGIKQGVGRSTVVAFGTQPRRRPRRARRGGTRRGGYKMCHHDAFHMSHLPLPRPVGPYTVIRTTVNITTTYKALLFGPQFDRQTDRWTNIAAMGFVDDTKTPADTGNMYYWAFNQLSATGFAGAQVTPSAFSIQMMNPGALQTTSGIIYAGRLRTNWKINENMSLAGTSLENNFISYNNPRLLAAAKLAFRGTQTDLVPFNMSDLANFTGVNNRSDGTATTTATSPENTGFAPFVVVNPSGIKLQFLVCCEWRVRFDPTNPAQASHVQHQAASESVWQHCLNMAEAMGNGVIDIADKVAETGLAAEKMMGAGAGVVRAGRGLAAAFL